MTTELMNGFPETSLQQNDVSALAKRIYRERRRALPTLPKSVEETISFLWDKDYKTNKGEPFVHSISEEKDIVMLTCKTNLECLCSCDELYIDGTFKTAPKFFEQVYIVHGYRNGNYVPLVFFLLPGKSEDLYTRMFRMLIRATAELSFDLDPKTVRIDFEKAVENALKTEFPATTVLCCRFHLGQSWHRKLVDYHLGQEYKNRESEIGQWLHMVFGLQHLQPDEIEDAFADPVMADCPNDSRCTKFTDYILANYVQHTSPWPPTMWADVPTLEKKRTNNGPEAFHRHLNSMFYQSHPSVFIFMDQILNIQANTYIRMRTLHMHALIRSDARRKVHFAFNQRQKLQNGDLTLRDYMVCLGHKFMHVQ